MKLKGLIILYICLMNKKILLFAAVSGALAVMLGALGAHALKEWVDASQLQVFETAVRYQMYHSLGLLFVSLLAEKIPSKNILRTGYCFMAGIILFSGSLYFLSLRSLFGIEGYGWIGAVTPLGGLSFIAGWLLIFFAALKSKS